MIPKIIHYCWFGGKSLPKSACRCIESWKKYCPGYIIKEWNENNFDVNQNQFVRESYEQKKYAFVSDFARFLILEQEGGVYFDVDVELLKPLQSILDKGAFMGCEENGGMGIRVNPGLGMAALPHMKVFRDMVNLYGQLKFSLGNDKGEIKTIVDYTTELLINYGLKDKIGVQEVEDIWIYPREYFAPQHYKTGKIEITDNTVSIHYYAASWFTPYQKFVNHLSHIIGEDATRILVGIKKKVIKCVKRG